MTTGADPRGVEFHDAQILEVVEGSGQIVLKLHAFVLDDFEDGNCSGAWQRIDLRFENGSFDRSGAGEQRALDGFLRVDERKYEDVFPIPLDEQGTVVLTLEGAGFALTVRGTRIELIIAGPPTKRESGFPSSS